LERFLAVIKFYVSGFYIKPDGVKKPVSVCMRAYVRCVLCVTVCAQSQYNPIIGETFRCMWEYADGSKAHFIAEQVILYVLCCVVTHCLVSQVSHHPPISCFYIQVAMTW
jgi:hypothetical protein